MNTRTKNILTLAVIIGGCAVLSTQPAAGKGCSGWEPPKPPFPKCVLGYVQAKPKPCQPVNVKHIPTCSPTPLFHWKHCETLTSWGLCKPYK
jgi:hypothetical protein